MCEQSQVVLLHDADGHLFRLGHQEVAKRDQVFLGGRRHSLPVGLGALGRRELNMFWTTSLVKLYLHGSFVAENH